MTIYMIRTPISDWIRCGAVTYFTVLARIQRGDGDGWSCCRKESE